MNYRETVNLPRTPFPQRANLPQREPEWLKFWERERIYEKSLEMRRDAPRYELHDGPPYSNGHIHCGHLLNKVLKDFVVRYRHSAGYRAAFVPGWDNHGLPIEMQVSQELQAQGRQVDKVTLRRLCREYADRWFRIQREEFQRLGVRGDWDHPYLTMDPHFEARIVEVFVELALQGYVYRGQKAIHWCPHCVTALAEAEIEYADKDSLSIYVAFPVREDPRGVLGEGPAQVLIWTTTPWTIPANLAIAVHPEFDYALLRRQGQTYVVAEGLVWQVMGAVGWEDYEVVGTVPGADLVGVVCQHPLYDRPSPLIPADYVTLDEGTGCVHTAPGHGKEDFELAQAHGLPGYCPVDEEGRFTSEVGDRLAGQFVFEANESVNAWLQEVGALLRSESYTHSYPHCWRCHQPVIFRATEQWFMNIDHLRPDGRTHRQACLDAIRATQWIPPESQNRITAMVEGRPDWCLSRQRAWGVGIPAFYCQGCGTAILDEPALRAVVELVRAQGSDAWFEVPAREILPPGFVCPQCGGAEFRKETDILDVWFDSGSTHQAVYRREELPIELYLEGSDQHRGWFNSALMIGVGMNGQAPYRTVLTHGFTLDKDGFPMSKSRGNVISPLDLMQEYGADVLRLWVASTDYFLDVRIGDEILQRIADAYRRIRNTFRYLLGTVSDFVPSRDAVPYAELSPLDRWMLHELEGFKERVRAAYESFEYHRIYQGTLNFFAHTLSAGYFDILKDLLYCGGQDSRERRAAQTVLYELLSSLARMLAPILVFTMEEVWQLVPEKGAVSVHLTDFPPARPEWRDEALAREFQRLLELRSLAHEALEAAVDAHSLGQRLTGVDETIHRLLQGEPPAELVNALRQAVSAAAKAAAEADLEEPPFAALAAQADDLSADPTVLRALHATVHQALEALAARPQVTQPLEAAITFTVGPSDQALLEKYADWLRMFFIVSQVELVAGTTPAVQVAVRQASGRKCERCWIVTEDVGTAADHPTLCGRCAAVVRAL